MANAKNAVKAKAEKAGPVTDNPPKEKTSAPVPQTKPAPSQASTVADASALAGPATVKPSAGVRMPAINDVRVAGRLTAEPVIKAVGNQNVANFNLAVEKKYLDGQNAWQKQVSFVPVAVWGAIADRASTFLHKGSPVYLEGRLRSSSWQTKDGQNRSMLRLEAFKIQSLAKSQVKSQGQEVGD